jgi:ferredoxin-NADP reductase/DMSO/TMAO reductase YedYZ heme-binding membrane subunit
MTAASTLSNRKAISRPMNQVQFNRMLVILNGAVPLVMLVWDAYHGHLGANAVNNALHVTGVLSLVFLFLSLAITPLRWITGWGGWIAFRRALGLYGFFYALIHLAIYTGFDRSLSLSSTLHEIWMRRFLQIGTAAVLLMVPLAVTSTNSMTRRMGPKQWKLLHRLAYLVAVLGVVHYYLLVKSDVRQPIGFGVVLAVLLISRFVRHYFDLVLAAKKSPSVAPAPLASKLVATSIRPMVPSHSSTSGATGTTKPPEVSTARQQWKGELKIAAIFQETHDVKTFRLMAADGGAFPFHYLPGQFLNIQLLIDGKRVNRSYTIASSPIRADVCELSIKREPMGLASRFIHDYLKVGDIVKVSGPSGKFVFTGQEASRVLLIAGGVGITPLMSILRYLTDRAWSGEIYFLIIARTESDLIFYDEIQWLKNRFPNLNVCATLTRSTPESIWKGNCGRATESLLTEFVPSLTQIPIYLCGPNEMMDATRNLLKGIGVPAAHIKIEAFGGKKSKISTDEAVTSELTGESTPVEAESISAEARSVAGATLQSATEVVSVTFARSVLELQVELGTTVLEAAEASSVEIPYECRSGICGQCKTRMIEGRVVMECDDALNAAEKASGLILACQAVPQGSVIIDA